MRRLSILLPAVALLCGCSDSLYYQTRYIPTDIESTYSVAEQATWSGDREAYELPAAPPDLEGEHRPRLNCAHPYQKFKDEPIAGMGDPQVHSSGDIGITTLVVTDQRLHPSGPTTALAEPPNYATDLRPFQPGLQPTDRNVPVSDTDHRPHSLTGAGTDEIPPVPYVGWNQRADPYCCADAPAVDAKGRPLTAAPRNPPPAK